MLVGCAGGEDDPEPEPQASPVVEPKAIVVVARAYVGERDAEYTTQDLEAFEGTRATVTVTFHNLRDDSVRDERQVVALAWDAPADAWRVVDAQAMYRCREGRGHLEFSAEICV